VLSVADNSICLCMQIQIQSVDAVECQVEVLYINRTSL
jgi:hypothetical protein